MDAPENGPHQEGKSKAPGSKYYGEYGPYVTLGLQLAAAVLVFYYLGSWLDERYNTGPTFTVVGIMMGAVGGLIKFFRVVMTLNKRSEQPKDRQQR